MNAPAWNIESEYASVEAPLFLEDMATIRSIAQTLRQKKDAKDIPTLQELFLLRQKAGVLISTLSSYTHCVLSVDATDAPAKAKSSEIDSLRADLDQAGTFLDIFIKICDEKMLTALLAAPELKAFEFSWRQERKRAPYLLTEEEESLLAGISVPGHTAWETLYGNLCGTMKVPLHRDGKTEMVGLAQAQAMTFLKEESQRKVAWEGVQEAWTLHQETAAAILNSLAGWRHAVNKKRSAKKALHYLETPLHENRIQAETLKALMTACEQNLEKTRQAPRLMAKVLQKKQLDPWDLLAPSPLGEASKTTSFEEAVALVREAFGHIDPSMADFVDMMVKNRWIEGRVLPNKTTGAYCTGFAKSKEPRVYMTYMGSDHDVSTLAHELGHAFHSWVLRDLPLSEQAYPMTLAETASVFAETALRDSLLKKSTTPSEKLDFSWGELESAAAFLINIPTRFEFEKRFYDLSQERTLSAKELCDVMDQAWSRWYGNTLTRNDRLFWAHKLHFSIAGDGSFYNFPYSFGYLFSLSIYARRKDLGSKFMSTYTALLRDTGRMTAEDLVQKHLGEDIKTPAFWQKSIDMVTTKLDTIASWT